MLPLRQPMLAPHKIPNLDKLPYPMWMSMKMDGIRCLIINGGLYSRSGKQLPNGPLHRELAWLIRVADENKLVLDGEIWAKGTTFQGIMSGVMSRDSTKCLDDDLQFHGFDALTYDEWSGGTVVPYKERYGRYAHVPTMPVVTQTQVHSADDAAELYDRFLKDGHEGAIIRAIEGTYKWGRCTFKECNMFKLKEFDELDAVVIGYEPLYVMSDDAEREYDSLGRPKPVLRQEFRQAADVLGKLVVRDERGREFGVGSGFNYAQRVELWRTRDDLKGRWIKCKSMTVGVKELPRHPIFLSFREDKT